MFIFLTFLIKFVFSTNYILTPKMKPVSIYNNCKFKSLSFETKYKHFVENELNRYNKVWSEITKIIKVEERH